MYLSDFIRLHGNEKGVKLWREYRLLFSISRTTHQNKYIPPMRGRDAFAVPKLFDFNLKSGYYWPDMIH